jgi:ribosomal protein S18 acetylase RimI-like enzyme
VEIEAMNTPSTACRNATPEDASALAELVNIAGEGLPFYLWSRSATPAETSWEIGRQRAMRDSGSFSWRNAIVREIEGEIAACLIGYRLPDAPAPIDYGEMPSLFVPLQELENLAAGTWYVNALATYPAHRGKGLGSELLAVAGSLARESQSPGISLIVADANVGARRLYERSGFAVRASRPMVKEGWQNAGETWLLLIRDLGVVPPR